MPRPVLIVRFDPDEHPPPGIGVIGSTFVQGVAAALTVAAGWKWHWAGGGGGAEDG